MDTLGAVFSILSLGMSYDVAVELYCNLVELRFRLLDVAFKTSLDGIAFAGYRTFPLIFSLSLLLPRTDISPNLL